MSKEIVESTGGHVMSLVIDSRTGILDHAALAGLRLMGFSRRWISTTQGRVHVLSADGGGSAPPVLLVHGFAAAGVHYFGLIRRLLPHVRRLIVPDALAHGFSDRPMRLAPRVLEAGLTEALDRVLAEPALVYGNSMGGLAALRYALCRPERVLGLVLCSPMGAPMTREKLAAFVQRFEVACHADALAFVDRVFRVDGPMRHLLAWGVRRRFCHPDMKALLESVEADDLLFPEDVRRLAPPLLLVWGKDERVLPPEHRDFFLAHLPDGAQVEETACFGHGPYLQHPEAVAQQILAFARALPRAARAALETTKVA